MHAWVQGSPARASPAKPRTVHFTTCSASPGRSLRPCGSRHSSSLCLGPDREPAAPGPRRSPAVHQTAPPPFGGRGPRGGGGRAGSGQAPPRPQTGPRVTCPGAPSLRALRAPAAGGAGAGGPPPLPGRGPRPLSPAPSPARPAPGYRRAFGSGFGRPPPHPERRAHLTRPPQSDHLAPQGPVRRLLLGSRL